MAEKKKKVVRIGGGSSGYMLLRGLKQYPIEITAVVNMFDSGGSSGVLRDELGILPPGDIRRALAALADDSKSDILRELFNFRFKESGSVSGHSFGNLFLAALSDICGSDIDAIKAASKILKLRGKVLPVSVDKSHLHAILENGTEISGETNIDIPKHNGELAIKRVFLDPSAQIFEDTRKEIERADVIVLGPGDLYTSIIPNLLVEGMVDALKKSKAKIVVIANLMTKWGETNGFCVSDMVRELLKYSELDRFDYVVCNTREISKKSLKKYALEKQFPMVCDKELRVLTKKIITGDLYSEVDILRHDSEKVAKIIMDICEA